MKIEFTSDNCFVVYYLFNGSLKTEDEIKTFFILLGYDLKKKYNYYFHGLYNVEILCFDGLYILNFDFIEDFGNTDFDITILLNTTALYEFDDYDLVSGNKIYYNGKYYVEVEDMTHDIHFFEYGDIIYGKDVERVLKNGFLINV